MTASTTRLGGTENLGLRPILPANRLVAREKVSIHPAATTAFETWRTIRFSARRSENLATAIPVLKNGNGSFYFFSNFRRPSAFRIAEAIPVTVVENLDESQIARIAWSEITLACHEQLHPKNGFRDIFRALKLVPPEVCIPIFGTLNPRSIAKKLCCDVSRFQESGK